MPEAVPGNEFGLELLVGQANYNRWARGFRIVALSKGLWRVFNDNWDVYTIRSNHLENRLVAEQGLGLLMLWVEPTLRKEIEEEYRPIDAWNYLKTRIRWTTRPLSRSPTPSRLACASKTART